jgi:hypothetical protein
VTISKAFRSTKLPPKKRGKHTSVWNCPVLEFRNPSLLPMQLQTLEKRANADYVGAAVSRLNYELLVVDAFDR